MAYETAGAGVTGVVNNAGAPSAGTNEVQTVTIANVTGGTFAIGIDGHYTAPITWSNVNATLLSRINTALDGLASGGSSWIVATDSTLASGLGDLLLTFSGGDFAKKAMPLATIADLSLTGSGAEITVAETTPGVTATRRDAVPGSLVLDTTNKKLYIHTGTQGAPTWTVVGSQS